MAALSLVVATSGTAHATGFTDIGQDFPKTEKFEFKLDGYMRARAEGLYNLDLDRGLLPNGQPLFPVPLDDPKGQWLTHADMRLHTDMAVYAPGGGVAVKVRLDTLDNVALGSMPDGVPYASLTQRTQGSIFSLRRAYGEALLPVGLLAVGRMGNQWGLGMYANGGDCLDCDAGDSVDRIAFLTPLFGHVFAFAFDYSATLALDPRADNRTIAIAPTSNVRSLTLAGLRFKSDLSRDRRTRAGKTTIEYGLLGSYRWQDTDVPSAYLPVPGNGPIPLTPAQVTARGANYYIVDGYAHLTHPEFSLAAEAAYIWGQVDQASLIPGVLLRQPITSKQLGIAVESEIGTNASPVSAWVSTAGTRPAIPAPSSATSRSLRRTSRSTRFASTPTITSTASSFARSSSGRSPARCTCAPPREGAPLQEPRGRAPRGGRDHRVVRVRAQLVSERRRSARRRDRPVAHVPQPRRFLRRVRVCGALPHVGHGQHPGWPEGAARAILPGAPRLHLRGIMRTAALLLFCLCACEDNRTPQPTHQPYDGGLPQLSCIPNLDGQIQANELQPALGNPVNYLVSPPGETRMVDLTGTVDSQGHQTWDFGADYADDEVADAHGDEHRRQVVRGELPGRDSSSLPFDRGATRPRASTRYDSTAIHAAGARVARSRRAAAVETLVVYQTPPIELYRFPLAVGVMYSSSGTITNGMLRGLPYAGTDTYDINIDASGQLTLENYVFTQVRHARANDGDGDACRPVSPSVTQRQTSLLLRVLRRGRPRRPAC